MHRSHFWLWRGLQQQGEPKQNPARSVFTYFGDRSSLRYACGSSMCPYYSMYRVLGLNSCIRLTLWWTLAGPLHSKAGTRKLDAETRGAFDVGIGCWPSGRYRRHLRRLSFFAGVTMQAARPIRPSICPTDNTRPAAREPPKCKYSYLVDSCLLLVQTNAHVPR